MKNGVFLQENRQPGKNGTSRRTREEREAARTARLQKKRNRQKIAVIGTLVILVLFVIAVLIMKSANPLVGRWNMDEVTSYEFFRNGKGALVLPSSRYEFTFVIDGDVVQIDFVYDGAKDAQYTFAVDGDVLILEGGNSTTKGTYQLTRSE